MKQTLELEIDQHNLVFTFFNLAGFTLSNNIVIDTDTGQPITYNGKYIYYNPNNDIIIGHSMVQLDLTRNNKVNETLFNYWCAKQHLNGKYVRYFNIFNIGNKTSQATEISMEIMDLDHITRQPIGTPEKYTSDGYKANSVIAFCYVIAQIEDCDLDDVIALNTEYTAYYNYNIGVRK